MQDLIERLKYDADFLEKHSGDTEEFVKDYREAADTIQLLSGKLRASQLEPCEDTISRQTEEYTEFEILKLGEGIIPYIKCKSCDGMNGMLANFCPWCGRRWKK